MDAPLEPLIYLCYVLFVLAVWIIFPPILLKFLSISKLSKQRVPFLLCYLLHMAAIPGLFFWLAAFLSFRTIYSPVWGLLTYLPFTIYQPFLLARPMKITLFESFRVWVLYGSLSCLLLLAAYGLYPTPHTPRGHVAETDMRGMATAIQDYDTYFISRDKEGRFPIPLDAEGNPVMGTLPEELAGTSIASASDNRLLYYRGPSFVPDVLIDMHATHMIPSDIFDPEQGRRYGYGMGPATGPSRAFLISSVGPDHASQAEQLEHLLLEKHKGNVAAFRKDPEVLNLTYSPTNGVETKGDLYRAETASR